MALTRIKNTAIPNLATSKITSGTFADARISSSSVVQHSPETDLQPVKSDLSALALREATNESSAAFNLPNQFIDTFATDVVGTKTDCAVSSGALVTESTVADPNAVSIFRPNNTDHTTSTTSISSKVSGDSATLAKVNTSHSGNNLVAIGKFSGGMAMLGTSADDGGWKINPTADYDFGTGDWTVEGWSRRFGSQDNAHRYIIDFAGTNSYDRISLGFKTSTAYLGEAIDENPDISSAGFFENATWTHWAFVKESNTTTLYIGGNRKYYATENSAVNWNSARSGVLAFQQRHGSDSSGWNNFVYTNEIRVSDIARYSGATYTVPTDVFPTTTTSISATGTAIQAANAVGSAKTKVGGTLLYKDNAGTNTLGTDLKVYMTCNGGSNWTEAASYNAVTPVYSTGVKQVRLGETTCTSGTDVRYKIEWANQAASSKEAQVHGIGLNY